MFSLFFIISYLLCILYADEDCKRNFSVRKNSIILTKASQSKGASFIHKQVVNRFSECFSLCCSNAECTVAVYENKVNHICFMFNCKEPNVCMFTDHEDYISMLHSSDQDTKSQNQPIKPSVVRNKAIVRPSMDAALGETCGTMRKCGPANSMCTSGTCICQIGYIGRGGLCVRSLCPKPELMFQCMDVSKSPFCIALYDQCNGISECGDGSDEVNCEPNQYRRPVFNETTNTQSQSTKIKPKPKFPQINNNIQATTHHKQSHNKKPTNIQNHSYSNQNAAPAKTIYGLNKKFRKSNPMAENQLLLLEPKNKIPKYPQRNSNDRSKLREHFSKVSSPPESNALYQKHQYAKMKIPSYPPVSKADEYYQKSSSDQSDLNNRWNNMDSNSNDYEYPPISSNNRDSGSEWDQDQYTEPSESDSPAKISPDRNGYIYYPDYDDEPYTKSRGRYISDSDRYRPKFSSSNGYEQSMDFNNNHKDPANNRHRLFVNNPHKVDNDINHFSTTMSTIKRANKPNSEDIDNRNMNEWNTAVIALSLGLLITAGLLVAVGFKMRTWRRRLKSGKKGKCLTTDEGDYLINGMYL